MERIEEAEAAIPRARWRETLKATGAAWALLTAAAAATGDGPGLVWAAVAPGLVLATIALTHRRGFAPVARWASAAYLVGLAGATIAAGLAAVGLDEAARVEGLARDANVLGAALAVAAAAWAAVAPARRWGAWAVALGWPLAATAVLYTGSRAAAGACLLAAATWLVLHVGRGRGVWVLPALAALVLLAAVAWQRGVVDAAPNLLAAPNDFAHREWRHDLAASVEVTAAAAEGPFDGTRAQRLRATARPDGRALLLQTIGRSEPGVPYVASLYLRAEAPQRVVVSNHLSEVACTVGTAWTRCATPPGIGDGVLQAQFYLSAAEPGGAVDVLAYGAQYEVGTQATPFRARPFAWLPQALVRRLDVRNLDLLPEDRRAIWAAALELGRTAPWTGVGAPAAAAALSDRIAVGVVQAHNALLHLWLVRGALGVAAAALLAGALAAALPAGAGRALAPLLVALVLTNGWDVTASDALVLAPTLLAVAGAGATLRRRSAPASPPR
jgi:O-antigen ligase